MEEIIVDKMYKAISIGLKKRILVEKNEVDDTLVSLYQTNPDEEFYTSVYDYTEKDKEQFEKTNSLSGFNNLKTDRIVFDFDSKSDVNKAKDDAIKLVQKLIDNKFDKSAIQIWSSGNKGFHVELKSDRLLSKSEVDAFVESYCSELETLDKAIYDYQRIIRAPLSKNKKSNAYKTPYTFEELKNNNIDYIKNIDKNSATDDSRWSLASGYLNSIITLPEIKIKAKEVKLKQLIDIPENRPDFNKNKTGLTNAKYALLNGFFEQGEGHQATMILASTLKSLGQPEDIAYSMIKSSYRLRNNRLGLPDLTQEGREKLYRCVEDVYSPLWKGGTYNEEENELLLKTKQRYGIDERFESNSIIHINELKDATESFLKDLQHNRIYTGLESLDKNLILTKGMLFGILGSPGSGKTTFLNIFMENTSKNHGPCLYFSMDMSKDLLGTKIIQRYTGYSLEKLEDMILHGTFDKKYYEAVEKFTEDYKNVGFCFENGYTVEKMSDAIKRYEDKIGNRISLVGVDYLEKVQGPYSEETANSGYVASNLANLAKKHDTCIGLLLQPSKASGSPADEFKSYRSIKGASKIEQDARAIIGIWRPGYSPEDYSRDVYMSIAILKQNMGKLGRFDYLFDGPTGGISEMSREQRARFKSFLEDLQNLKEEKEKKDWI